MNDYVAMGVREGGVEGRGQHAGRRVLVVEDSRAMRALLCSRLDVIEGIAVDQAASLAEARELLRHAAGDYFVAVLDLNLGDAPNGEIVPLVRAAGIPIIVLTGSADEDVRRAMRSQLVLDYVVKRQAEEIEHVAFLVRRLHENRAVKVLVVDDQRTFRSYLGQLLANYRYQVLFAEDGEAGLRVLAENPDISLVLTDYEMPRMNGLEFIAAVRREYRREDLAIIGISDSPSSDLTVRLLKVGANDFITKRFEMEEFYCRVAQNTSMVGYVRRIRDSAIRDPLTKVYNRRHLFEVGENLLAQARRGMLNLAVGIIDADHFKKINDTWGHATGDRALVQIASTLGATLRKSDVVARFGGEEFVCCAVVRDPADAVLVFEKVRARLQAIELASDGGEPVPVTASIGVTTRPAEAFESMVKEADGALYQAKAGGRNRVVLAQG